MNAFIRCALLAGVAAILPASGNAAPARKAIIHKKAAAAAEGELSAKTGPGAPFAKVIIDFIPDSCGSMGCTQTIAGVTAAGKTIDLTPTEILTNGTAGTKAQIFGSIDATGMPRIVLELGLFDGGAAFSLFTYKPALRRYVWAGKVSGYAAGKSRAVSGVMPSDTVSAPRKAADPVYEGKFAFPVNSAPNCEIDTDKIMRKVGLRKAGNWTGLIAETVS